MLLRALRGVLAGIAAGLFSAGIIFISGAWAVIGVKFQVVAVQAFAMHMLFSSLSGLLFSLLVGRFVRSWVGAIAGGVLFSSCLYLLVAFTVMPLRFGATPSLGWDFLRVLIGHGIFGLVLGSSWQALGRFMVSGK